jgi:hypothetical protein
MIELATHSKSDFLEPTFVNIVLDLFKTKLFVTRTAGELISGYNDTLMSLAHTFMPKVVKSGQFSLVNGVSIFIVEMNLIVFYCIWI